MDLPLPYDSFLFICLFLKLSSPPSIPGSVFPYVKFKLGSTSDLLTPIPGPFKHEHHHAAYSLLLSRGWRTRFAPKRLSSKPRHQISPAPSVHLDLGITLPHDSSWTCRPVVVSHPACTWSERAESFLAEVLQTFSISMGITRGCFVLSKGCGSVLPLSDHLPRPALSPIWSCSYWKLSWVWLGSFFRVFMLLLDHSEN